MKYDNNYNNYYYDQNGIYYRNNFLMEKFLLEDFLIQNLIQFQYIFNLDKYHQASLHCQEDNTLNKHHLNSLHASSPPLFLIHQATIISSSSFKAWTLSFITYSVVRTFIWTYNNSIRLIRKTQSIKILRTLYLYISYSEF